jgi:chromosome segregation ATPase
MITDLNDHTIFTDAMELHYINMKAFVKAVNRADGVGKDMALDTMLAKWLMVITEKDIKDKTMIRTICEEQEEISMAVSTLARLSEDKIARQAYRRRQDDINSYNMQINNYKRSIEEEKQRAGKEKQRAEKEKQRAEKEKQRAEKEKQRAEKAESILASQEATNANLEKKITELKAQLEEIQRGKDDGTTLMP